MVRASDLSERDLAVLADLARVRLLTGRFVERLQLSEGSPLTRARRTRSLLQRLNDMGLVTRMERQVGGVRAGSSGFVYALAANGQRLTTGHGPVGGVRRRRPWEPARLFVDHILAVSEVFVDLREAEREQRIELLAFEAEPACWRHWHGQSNEALILKPDAFTVIGSGDFEHSWFVEVDLGTESRSVIKRKAMVYAHYWRSGEEQRQRGLFPRVLWLTDTERRRDDLTEALASLDPELWQLFQVGLRRGAVELVARDDKEQQQRKEQPHERTTTNQ